MFGEFPGRLRNFAEFFQKPDVAMLAQDGAVVTDVEPRVGRLPGRPRPSRGRHPWFASELAAEDRGFAARQRHVRHGCMGSVGL